MKELLKHKNAVIAIVGFILLVIIVNVLTAKRAYGIRIRNIVNWLPRKLFKSYSTRNLSKINRVVIHHSDTTSGTPQSYALYHINKNKWPGIGYHFVIQKDGTIYQTQHLSTVSYHTSGENTRSIGICLTGDYDTQTPPEVQIAACVKLIRWLENKELKRSLHISGHNEYSTKSCPGSNLNINEIAARVKMIA